MSTRWQRIQRLREPPELCWPLEPGQPHVSVEAKDTAGNLSSAANFTWTVDTTVPPKPVITSTPANPTNQTSASFGFSDTQPAVSFQCQLDGSGFSACTSPTTILAP